MKKSSQSDYQPEAFACAPTDIHGLGEMGLSMRKLESDHLRRSNQSRIQLNLKTENGLRKEITLLGTIRSYTKLIIDQR